MIKHYTNVEDTLKYLKANPAFVSGFTSGEGCFSAYLGVDTSLTWGLQPCCEFSITQNSGDLVLLESFNQFFQTIPAPPSIPIKGLASPFALLLQTKSKSRGEGRGGRSRL